MRLKNDRPLSTEKQTLRKIHLLGMVAHFSSSDVSGQSGTPSQTRELSKQMPSLAHRNWPGGHWYTKQNEQNLIQALGRRTTDTNLFLQSIMTYRNWIHQNRPSSLWCYRIVNVPIYNRHYCNGIGMVSKCNLVRRMRRDSRKYCHI